MSDQQQASGGGELSQFEALSAIIPKKQPMAILIGTAVTIVALWVINALAPTETVDDLKKQGSAATEAAAAAAAPTSGSGSSIDDI
ncbi:MAG TPA: hypothetical protein VM285_12905 [Polyangia bacterium]|nr:hypothetical protein [Polyangia bacterium]